MRRASIPSVGVVALQVLALVVLISAAPFSARAQSTPVVLDQGSAPLNGPWRFHLGDDPRWKDAAFDDAAWETQDLTPKPGAHDNDVGIRDYVPGWSARGHKGYGGYAWYRMRVAVQTQPAGAPLAIEAPPYVDGAYQFYLNGRLLGGAGRFGATPTVYGHQPRMLRLPADVFTHGPATLAIRVYTPAFLVHGDPEGGGVHVAPVVGKVDDVEHIHTVRWMESIWGYIVDGAEAVVALLLIGLTALVAAFDRTRTVAYRWIMLGLLSLAIMRGEQIVLFWTQIQGVGSYDLVRNVFASVLGLLAWTMAWREWLGPKSPTWGGKAILGLTAAYGLLLLSTRPELGLLPHAAVDGVRMVIQIMRLVYLAIMLASAGWGTARQGVRAVLPVIALLIMAVVLFPQELSKIGAPGIWFPWGVGVSRTQYALAAFDVVLIALLVRELLRFAPGRKTEAVSSGV